LKAEAIIEHIVVAAADFGYLDGLTATLENGMINFIRILRSTYCYITSS